MCDLVGIHNISQLTQGSDSSVVQELEGEGEEAFREGEHTGLGHTLLPLDDHVVKGFKSQYQVILRTIKTKKILMKSS